MHTNRAHFPKIRAFIFYFKKGQERQKMAGETSPPPSPLACKDQFRILSKIYEKQSLAHVLQNRCSKKIRKCLKKTSVLESLFSKVC